MTVNWRQMQKQVMNAGYSNYTVTEDIVNSAQEMQL